MEFIKKFIDDIKEGYNENIRHETFPGKYIIITGLLIGLLGILVCLIFIIYGFINYYVW